MGYLIYIVLNLFSDNLIRPTVSLIWRSDTLETMKLFRLIRGRSAFLIGRVTLTLEFSRISYDGSLTYLLSWHLLDRGFLKSPSHYSFWISSILARLIFNLRISFFFFHRNEDCHDLHFSQADILLFIVPCLRLPILRLSFLMFRHS